MSRIAGGIMVCFVVFALAGCPVPTSGDPGGPTPLPETIDISGWTLYQTGSAQTWTVPADTILEEGGALIVVRDAEQAAFETFWGLTLTANVIFANSGGTFPQLNGSETYEIQDDLGAPEDGPTFAMTNGGNLQRAAGMPAGDAGSWTSTTGDPGNATPGTAPASSGNGIYISEISDANGVGSFVYEFVEIRFDGTP